MVIKIKNQNSSVLRGRQLRLAVMFREMTHEHHFKSVLAPVLSLSTKNINNSR